MQSQGFQRQSCQGEEATQREKGVEKRFIRLTEFSLVECALYWKLSTGIRSTWEDPGS